jgi:hypothetical protein
MRVGQSAFSFRAMPLDAPELYAHVNIFNLPKALICDETLIQNRKI